MNQDTATSELSPYNIKIERDESKPLPEEYKLPVQLKELEQLIINTVNMFCKILKITKIEYLEPLTSESRPLALKAYTADKEVQKLIFVTYGNLKIGFHPGEFTSRIDRKEYGFSFSKILTFELYQCESTGRGVGVIASGFPANEYEPNISCFNGWERVMVDLAPHNIIECDILKSDDWYK